MRETMKSVWSNIRYIKAQQEVRLQSRIAFTSDEIDATYERLKVATEGDKSLRKDLDKLKVTADGGVKYSRWGRRFAFGFGVRKAIEDWFLAFDNTDPNKPILERLPRDETTNVAAKWIWFGFLSTLIGATVATIPAYLLYQQTGVLAEQAATNRDSDKKSQRVQYIQFLFDEICEPNAVPREHDSATDKPLISENCRSAYNARIRSEAARAFLELERLDTKRADFQGARLDNTNLQDINFGGANLSLANLNNANLNNANLAGANLEGAFLAGAQLLRVNLAIANLADVDLSHAYLAHANLETTDLDGADLSSANLSKTRFYEAHLRGANLAHAHLEDANFENANLREAILIEADLVDAIFKGASLQGANLFGADLEGVDFEGANIEGANVYGTDFSDTNVTQSQLDVACGSKYYTALPEGLTIKECKIEE